MTQGIRSILNFWKILMTWGQRLCPPMCSLNKATVTRLQLPSLSGTNCTIFSCLSFMSCHSITLEGQRAKNELSYHGKNRKTKGPLACLYPNIFLQWLNSKISWDSLSYPTGLQGRNHHLPPTLK